MNRDDTTTEHILANAAHSDLTDDAFLMVRRAIAGLDPATGEPPTEPPKRMSTRRWQRDPRNRFDTGRHCGWWWRCRHRTTCGAWGGPYKSEIAARNAAYDQHSDAH